MKPRVLFIGQTGQLGGAELGLLDFVPHFLGRCRIVLMADGPLRARLEALGAPVTLLPAASDLLKVSRGEHALRALSAAPHSLRAAWRLAALARDYDVIYPNSQKAAVVAMLAGPIARRPVVWHLHDILSADHFGGMQRRVVVTLANLVARRVITNSFAARDAFVASGGDRARVGVVWNGLDPRPFAANDRTAAYLRATLAADGRPLVGLFGRISPWKGQAVLLAALRLLPEVRAVFVGDALFGESGLTAQLRRDADASGVGDRVTWLGFRDDVPELMQAMDVIVHASTSAEPFGRVVLEAMLARKPVLATALGGPLELLGSGHPHLVPAGDATAMAAAIQSVLAMSEAERSALVAANEARALAHFTIERMVSSLDRELALAM